MIAKVIIAAIIVALVYFLIVPKFRKKSPDSEIENFVECHKCGTFINVDEAILQDGEYCCKECVK